MDNERSNRQSLIPGSMTTTTTSQTTTRTTKSTTSTKVNIFFDIALLVLMLIGKGAQSFVLLAKANRRQVLLFACQRGTTTAITTSTTSNSTQTITKSDNDPPTPPSFHVDVSLGYNHNPTITSTALAHQLWKHVVRPGIDSAVDATAGNGGDSVVLAQLLFPESNNNNNTTTNTTNSHLVCIDIQKEACETTRRQLERHLSSQLMQSHVHVVHASHAPLPLPMVLSRPLPLQSPVALVVYNLGYLPTSSKQCLTKTDSTIQSMADAALALRRGGLLSVITYPRSNQQEDWAVRVFLEGLALFSSSTVDWKEFIHTVPYPFDDDGDDGPYDWTTSNQQPPRQVVREALERVWDKGGGGTTTAHKYKYKHIPTWRVQEHKKLGWTDAPILFTATRIK